MTRVCGLARLPESNDYKHLLGPLKKRPKGFKSVTGESRAMVYVYTGVLVLVVLLAVVHLAIKLYRNLNRCVCGVCGVYVCASHQVHESACRSQLWRRVGPLVAQVLPYAHTHHVTRMIHIHSASPLE